MNDSPPRRDLGLARLRRLEWRHDGPLPPGALARLNATEIAIAREAAAADGAVLDRLARDAVRAGADRRGGYGPEALIACRRLALARRAGQG